MTSCRSASLSFAIASSRALVSDPGGGEGDSPCCERDLERPRATAEDMECGLLPFACAVVGEIGCSSSTSSRSVNCIAGCWTTRQLLVHCKQAMFLRCSESYCVRRLFFLVLVLAFSFVVMLLVLLHLAVDIDARRFIGLVVVRPTALPFSLLLFRLGRRTYSPRSATFFPPCYILPSPRSAHAESTANLPLSFTGSELAAAADMTGKS